jgi:hypothetical protein
MNRSGPSKYIYTSTMNQEIDDARSDAIKGESAIVSSGFIILPTASPSIQRR